VGESRGKAIHHVILNSGKQHIETNSKSLTMFELCNCLQYESDFVIHFYVSQQHL